MTSFPVTSLRPPLANLRLGPVDLDNSDLKVLDLVTSGKRLGQTEGYTTLKAARADLALATAGEYYPAAGVFRHETAHGLRYFGQALDMKYMDGTDPGGGPMQGPFRTAFHHLKVEPETTTFQPYRRGELAQELVAIVDGRQSIEVKSERRGPNS